jgi:D-proline reductase (dithiol) PrdB
MTSSSTAPADLDTVDYIVQTRDTYASLGYGEYRWAENPDRPPFADAPADLSKARVALIASGGIYAAGQVAFTHKDDVSFREIPTDTPLDDVRVTHFAYDQTDARRDPNVVFPLGTLRRLADDGVIAGLTSHALTFMGGIYSQRRLRQELIPRFVERVQQMAADVVLLVPV